MRVLILGFCVFLSCDRSVEKIGDENIDTAVQAITDNDGDGYFSDEDCDDYSSSVYPEAAEICDGLDNDCDGEVDDGVLDTFYEDLDGDGFGNADIIMEGCEALENYSHNGNDCDDENAASYPGASEQCDGLDNDCDELIDEDLTELWYYDGDGDGFGIEDDTIESCIAEEGYVGNSEDCDDEDEEVHPDAEEVCDYIDNNCDEEIDEDVSMTVYVDVDADGYGEDENLEETCELGENQSLFGGDCDDLATDINPGMDEICDFFDNNCDGDIDEDTAIDSKTWYYDNDGDGYGDPNNTLIACFQPNGYVLSNTDCDDDDDTIYSGASELCDGQVNSCGNSLGSDEIDDDGDGYVECTIDSGGWDGSSISGGEDCNDGENTIYPSASELCDGQINNCSTSSLPSDEIDDDSDGYVECTIDSGGWDGSSISGGEDCDDGENTIYPSASELCDGQVNSCGNSLGSDEIDDDGDGYVECTIDSGGWDGSSISGGEDCNDGENTIYPSASELCDGQINNCSTSSLPSDEIDDDSDGYVECTIDSGGWDGSSISGGEDCDDGENTIYPSASELCDGQINNCSTSSLPSDEIDNDSDGYVECTIDSGGWDGSSISGGEDCNDGASTTHPNAAENESNSSSCMTDDDGDGYGSPTPASGAIAGTDCDDSNAAYNPAAGCFGTSCKDVLDMGLSTGDGNYLIDPDGIGTGDDPFYAYCDMTSDGGGWTRVVRLNASSSINSINKGSPFFSAAWQQHSTSYSNTSNDQLILDSSTYGMIESTDLVNSAASIRFSCTDSTRNLSGTAIWSASSTQKSTWLTEQTDSAEYLSSAYSVQISKNGSGYSNANVYLTHTESAYFGCWHICGGCSAVGNGFQLGFCANSPSSYDQNISNANQIAIGYHPGYNGLRLECTADTPSNTPILSGNFNIWTR